MVYTEPRFYSRVQPFKSVYCACFVLYVLLRLPFWAIEALIFERPRKSWSLWTALCVKTIRTFVTLLTRAGLHLSRDLAQEPKSLKLSRFTWAKSVATERIGGFVQEMAARNPDIKVDRVPCFFFARNLETLPRAQSPDEPLIIYLHGGAYFLGTAHESDPTNRKIPLDLLSYSKKATKVMSVDYRVGPLPFPAALLDALSAYAHAIELGYSRIVLIGDSAGGNLALATLRALRDSKDLPLPLGAALISPWTDMTLPEIKRDRRSDVLDGEMGPHSVARFFKDVEQAQTTAYCSPGSKKLTFDDSDFTGFPPMLFVAGDAEIILDEIELAHDRFKQGGTKTKLIVAKDACHDFVLFSFMEAHGASKTMKDIAAWIDALL